MKIVFLQGHGATNFYRLGWIHAISEAHECYWWNPETESCHDMFARQKPDYIFIGTWELNRAIIKCIQKYGTKVILWGTNHGYFNSQIDEEDTVSMASEEEVMAVYELLKISQIKYIFSYYHQNRVTLTHDAWEYSFGLKPIGLPLAADIIDYPLSQPSEEFECDLAFVGGYWPYKGTNLNKYLIPLCNENYKIKIFGNGSWPVGNHLGILETKDVSTLFSSAKICPNIFEPLAAKYGFDVNERTYKILSSGGFCISEYVESAAEDIFTSNEVLFVKNPEEFKEQVDFFLEHPSRRLDYIRRGIKSVYNKHTYFHRAIELFKLLELDGIELLQKVIDSYKEKYGIQ